MGEVKYYNSPRWSGEVLDCSMPMTFDQFSRCSYNCLYCFSYFQRALQEVNPNQSSHKKNYLLEDVRGVNVEGIRDLFCGKKKSPFTQYIADRYWMQWGGLSDPFDEFERERGTGLELLKFFSEIRYPICFSTKGTWWTRDERYMELFERNRDIWNVKFSIINLDPQLSASVELRTPSPSERLEAMWELARIGVKCTLRLRPFIIGMSDRDAVELIREAPATAVSTEFMCIESRLSPGVEKRYEAMGEAIGLDILDFYRRNSRGGGYLRLNWRLKKPYVDRMERAALRCRKRFYVSDAHHKDRCATGSCCGLPDTANYHRGQFTEALVLAKRNGRVHFRDLQIMPCFREVRAVQGPNFMRGSPSQRARFHNYSMYDMVRYFGTLRIALKVRISILAGF